MLDVGYLVKDEPYVHAFVEESINAIDIDKFTEIVLELEIWESSSCIRFGGGEVQRLFWALCASFPILAHACIPAL